MRKAKDQKVLAAVFHIWEERRSQTGKRLPERAQRSLRLDHRRELGFRSGKSGVYLGTERANTY